MTKRKYDSTVARMAGNILSGYRGGPKDEEDALIAWAVDFARAIVEEVERSEPSEAVPAVAGTD